MPKMKDLIWLWGQDPGSHHNAIGNKNWKLPGENKMDPAEGGSYMGINNMCRVVMSGDPVPPFDGESEKIKDLDRVVWSAIGDGGSTRNNADESDIEEVIRQAEKYPNVSGAIFDDFFIVPENGEGKVARHSLDSVKKIRQKLQSFPGGKLDLWVVWYKKQLDKPVGEYLELFDVVTYWNMRAPADLEELDADFQKVVDMTPGKRRMTGCYMWNYGEGKPLSIREIRTECEKYYQWIKEGLSGGIIFCSNCCADLGLEAVEWVREWIKDVREEEV